MLYWFQTPNMKGAFTMMTTDRYLTTEEATEIIPVSANTLRGWRHRKIGPKSMTVGARKVVYKASDLYAWLDEQEKKASA